MLLLKKNVSKSNKKMLKLKSILEEELSKEQQEQLTKKMIDKWQEDN